MLLKFHKMDQQSIRKNALILFVINLLAWSIASMGKSLHLPKIVFIVFFSIFIICVIAFLVYMYRFLDPKDKKVSLHPDFAGVAPEIRSGIFSLYMHSLLFSILPLNIFGNILGLELNSFLNIVIYLGLCALMAWTVYRIADLSKMTTVISDKSHQVPGISDEKATNFFIIGYILIMALIAFLLYKSTV